jgi:hypothetical protein
MVIEKLIRHISSGIDQIIKAGGEKSHSEIDQLVNSVWNKEELPEVWKESITVLIYKRGDKTDCSNYTGIALLSTTYRILYSILLSRLTPHTAEIIRNHKYGFRRKISTTDHIFCIRQILKKNVNKMQQYIRYLQTSRKLMIQLGGRSCIIFLLSLVSP